MKTLFSLALNILLLSLSSILVWLLHLEGAIQLFESGSMLGISIDTKSYLLVLFITGVWLITLQTICNWIIIPLSAIACKLPGGNYTMVTLFVLANTFAVIGILYFLPNITSLIAPQLNKLGYATIILYTIAQQVVRILRDHTVKS